MPNKFEVVMTGGCQCGAIRYALHCEPPTSICFCRMCQKASGNYFGAFAGSVPEADLTWTSGQPSIFRSSEAAERGFCEKCGTPLSFRYIGSGRVSVTAGSLDEPTRVRPSKAHGLEGRPAWFSEICALAGNRTEDEVSPEKFARYASRQHPDHDA